MAVAVRGMSPVAQLPVVLGIRRQLKVACGSAALMPPHRHHVMACGPGVAALVLAILAGDHGRYQVGSRLAERGLRPLLQAGIARESRHDGRLGQRLDAVLAAPLNGVFRAVARNAGEVYGLETPWRHHETTTLSRSGASAGGPADRAGATPASAAAVAPRPAVGQSQERRPDLTQVGRRLGGSGEGGVPRRLGSRAGNPRDSPATPVALAECVALGLEGMGGIVAASTAESQRPLGRGIEKSLGVVTRVPRPGLVRHEVEAWGPQPSPLPGLVEKPGRTTRAAPRRWRGQSVVRAVAGEDRAGHVEQKPRRCVGGHSRPLAPHQAQAFATAQGHEAGAGADDLPRVAARRFACWAEAEAAIAQAAGTSPGQRGRTPQRWP
jgi:hypothetical protein